MQTLVFSVEIQKTKTKMDPQDFSLLVKCTMGDEHLQIRGSMNLRDLDYYYMSDFTWSPYDGINQKLRLWNRYLVGPNATAYFALMCVQIIQFMIYDEEQARDFYRFHQQHIRDILNMPNLFGFAQSKIRIRKLNSFLVTWLKVHGSQQHYDDDRVDAIIAFVIGLRDMLECQHEEWKMKQHERQERMAPRELLTAAVWHPRRVERWIDSGLPLDSVYDGFVV